MFLTLALTAAGIAWWIYQKSLQPVAVTTAAEEEFTDVQTERSDVSWEDVSPVDTLGLEVGYKLIPLVDKNQSGELLSRIRGVRKKLSQELGFLVPTIHIRDNLDLLPNGYRFSLMGVNIGEAEIFLSRIVLLLLGKKSA